MTLHHRESRPGPPAFRSTLLRSALIAGTPHRQDIVIVDDRIDQVGPGGQVGQIDLAGSATGFDDVIDLDGYVVFPSFVEPHAHLDKALLVDESVPPGDLSSAVELFRTTHYARMRTESVTQRARTAARIAVARGCTAVRTHVDCGSRAGLSALAAMLELREELRGVLDLQVVALVLPPVTGDEGAAQRQVIERVLDMGVDVLGGCPTLDPHPRAALDVFLAAASARGVPVDFHLDETTDAASSGLVDLAAALGRANVAEGVTASHCVSLGQHDCESRNDVVGRVCAAGIGIVTLPQTNLLLQGRDHCCAVPRALPPIRALLDAGVLVAGGGDNWRDPFNPLSRIDPLETVSLLVSAGHLSPEQAVDAVTHGARKVLGLPEVRVAAGYSADLVAVRGDTMWAALADASEERVVLNRGRVVARTEVTTRLNLADI